MNERSTTTEAATTSLPGSNSSVTTSSSSNSSTCYGDMMDEADDETKAQIDLALSTNFDPSFFDYGWTEPTATTTNTDTTNNNNDVPTTRHADVSSLSRERRDETLTHNMILDHGFSSSSQESGSETNVVTDGTNSTTNTHQSVVTSSSLTDTSTTSTAHPPPTTTSHQNKTVDSSNSDIMSTLPALHPPLTSSASAALASYTAQQQALAAAVQQQQQQPGSGGSLVPAAAAAAAALLPLTYNAMAASGGVPNTTAASTLAQIMATLPNVAPPLPSSSNAGAPITAAPPPPAKAPPPVTSSGGGHSHTTTSSNSNLPPFLLFDAPIELRANFMAVQQANGMPTLEDNNAFHYGLSVNGFHPQQQQSPPSFAGTTTKHGTTTLPAPQLIDGRHGNVGSKHVRNAREQKRTQKIADLIDQLRLKMERGGWKVGVKSKFHTLSSCADYVKHLVKVNKDKEQALEKTKIDLEAKRRKLEEERNAHQDPSDPESTTSSLTVSSGTTSDTKMARSEKDDSSPLDECDPDDSQESTKESSWAAESEGNSRKRKLGGTVFVNQTCESVSDLTDSNKGSSSEGNSSGSSHSRRPSGGDAASKDTVLSDAAVARGVEQNQHGPNPSDVFVKKKRKVVIVNDAKRKRSVENSFELDYKEVFLKSNVPQLLATTSGRVVAWNEFFLKVTGLTEEEASKITIFSLVRSNKLSDLFEIVAAALRSDESVRNESSKATASAETKEESSQSSLSSGGGKWNYTAITLPCTSFRRSNSESDVKPLYITVTLMSDEDPRKRCFHCAFTDFPGSNGTMGVVTQDALSLMFTKKAKQGPSAAQRESGPKRKKSRSMSSSNLAST